MRLLHTTKLRVEDFGDTDIPPYAILSHTWQGRETTFQEIQTAQHLDSEGGKSPGLAKIERTCVTARQDGFDYVWVDTCCIDKTSSAELSEAINSIFQWYKRATVCYAYLVDVPPNSVDLFTGTIDPAFRNSRWFTRGWTLPELIAPSNVTFLDQEWGEIGTKLSLQRTLSEITGIPVDYLLRGHPGYGTKDFSIAQKMSWASQRTTTRVEDRAYSLLGLLNINMPMLYGEGEKSFVRLQEEIIKVSDDHSIFAWAYEKDYVGLLATSPDAFAKSGNIIPSKGIKGIKIDNRGIHVKVRILRDQNGTERVILPCTYSTDPDAYPAIHVVPVEYTRETFVRKPAHKLDMVQMEKSKLLGIRETEICFNRREPQLTINVDSKHNCIIKLASKNSDAIKPELVHLLPGWSICGQSLKTEIEISSGISARLVVVCNDGAFFQLLLRIRGRELQANVAVDLDTDLTKWQDEGDRIAKILNGNRRLNVAVKTQIQPGQVLGQVVELKYTSPSCSDDLKTWIKCVAVVEPDIKEDMLFHYAASRGLEPLVKLLLERAVVSPNMKDFSGSTPLSLAAENGHEEVVQLLTEDKIVDINSRDNNGRTALWKAAGGGFINIVKALLSKNGIEPDLKDNHGQSPLSRAAWAGREEVVKVLLESGRVNENTKDKIGRTPLYLAKNEGHIGVVKLLQEHKVVK